MAYTLQFRRDIATNWTTNNPILAEGEIGYETDTSQLKIGNGVDDWNTLIYWGGTGSSSKNTDGGNASSVYLEIQNIDGGSANG